MAMSPECRALFKQSHHWTDEECDLFEALDDLMCAYQRKATWFELGELCMQLAAFNESRREEAERGVRGTVAASLRGTIEMVRQRLRVVAS